MACPVPGVWYLVYCTSPIAYLVYVMVWYGMVGPDQSLAIFMVGPLGRGPELGLKVKVKVKVGAKLNRFRFALGRKIPSL